MSLKSQRDKFKQRIADLALEDDPLGVYYDFVQWTINNLDENDPNSGLTQLLDEATRKFKDDGSYKGDLRYLKLWTFYANRVSQRSAIGIYSQLWKNDIGVTYSLLYEEYARMLESVGRVEDANQIYYTGLNRQAHPTERLKARYAAFRERHGKKPFISQHKSTAPASSSSPKTSTAASRYATMLAPPQPGKRPEKLRFDISLLYTKQSGEFCIEEARTRSMGLLRKEWAPVESLTPCSSSLSLRGDDITLKQKNLMAGEPTVTINTREALEDVFGMYNSPDRTVRMGSKHAPVKKIDPGSMPRLPPSLPTVFQSGTNNALAFRPFVDENFGAQRKENKQTLAPFDPDRTVLASSSNSKPAFTAKEISPASQNGLLRNAKTQPPSESVFSKKVFIAENKAQLAPLRDAFTEDHGQPRPKTVPTHERAKSDHDVGSKGSVDSAAARSAVAFRPFVDTESKTPFKVFSRPSDVENASTPKPATQKSFVPFVDAPTFTPYRDRSESVDDQPPTQEEEVENYVDAEDGHQPIEQQQHQSIDLERYPDEDENDYSDDFIDEEVQGDFESPIEDQLEAEADEVQQVPYQDIPFGGRFGQFNVMTPITERTFEFTHSNFNTPSNLLHHVPELDDEEDEEQLAAAQLVPDGADNFEEEEEQEDDAVRPLQLPPKEDDAPSTSLSQSTSRLSLADTLTSLFDSKPPNPCNPFDPPILRNLISRLNPDSHCYDYTDTDRNGLEDLQKFGRKNRKTSGNSSSGGGDGFYPLTLAGQKFVVSEKLGEGGFGAVFKAKDLGAQSQCDSDSEDDGDDGDDEGASLVALKVVKPRNFWEYHVLRRLHSALPPNDRKSIVFPHALYAFRDESYLVLDYCAQGTLLDIVNSAESAGVSQHGACLDELLVMFFTVELLRLLEHMHNMGFIHGDLKIDNCLLRLEEVPGGSSAWSSKYQPSGEGGWSYKGLKVIDFGRTIDTRLFPSNQQFIADWTTDERDCMEIQHGRPWTFQTDYFGLVGIVYCMFFGKYIHSGAISSATSDGQTRLKLTTPLKRYWQTELWGKLFDVLLNPTLVRPERRMPLSDELGRIRGEMERWLEANCNRTTATLKGLLKKVEMSCL